MRQSPVAKTLWSTFIRHNEGGSFFQYHCFPDLIDAVDRNLPSAARVVLLGGGPGHLARLVDRPGRTWLNIDIAPPPDNCVETRAGDMEEPLDRFHLRSAHHPLAAITPFSMDYTDVRLSSGHIGDVLLPQERLIWLAHHADSNIVENFRSVHRMLPLLAEIRSRMRHLDPRRWVEIGRDMEPRIDAVWNHLLKEAGVCIADAEPSEFERLRQVFLANREKPMQQSFIVLFWLRQISENPHIAAVSESYFDAMQQGFQSEALLTELLIQNTFRGPTDLERVLDPRFRLLEGRVIPFSTGEPVALVAVFEKK